MTKPNTEDQRTLHKITKWVTELKSALDAMEYDPQDEGAYDVLHLIPCIAKAIHNLDMYWPDDSEDGDEELDLKECLAWAIREAVKEDK